MKQIKEHLNPFIKETQASLSIEAVLIIPILLWAFLAMYVFFDGYRTQNLNLKASYAIGDLLSREVDPVGPDYIDGLDSIFRYLAHNPEGVWIRVSLVKWNADDSLYELVWSYNTKSDADAQPLAPESVKNKLPIMEDQDTIIVVETHADFTPQFNVSLSDVSLDNFIVTSPRFTSTVVWDDDL